MRALPAESASAKATPGPHCPDRVDRAKTGGFVGGLVGTAVATLVGSPVLGVLYQLSGYAIGFASDGNCGQPRATVQNGVVALANPGVNIEKAVVTTQKPEATIENSAPAPQPAPSSLSFSEIKEENLSTNGRP